ncbi:MAG TPA: hypothetical protein PKA41_07920 [Verrucomicrobiota bacterium]|nr:hypothetical protein [Verrucomicrobiota bacterium]
MIIIHLRSGSVRNQLEALTDKVEHPRQVLAAGQIAGRRSLQRHFTEKDRAGNKLGGRRTHFWGDVRESTQLGELTDRSADIDIGDRRFPQRLYGGTIKAKTPWPFSGFLLLTIPVHPAARGRRASVAKREMGVKLTFVGNAGGGILAHFPKHAGTLSAGESEGITYYVCVPSVDQTADPTALPDREQWEREIVEAAQDELTSQAKAVQQQPGESTP